jgi:hypothetical protein
MDLTGIDRDLAGLRTTVAAMSTNLVDLENDAGRTRLDQGALTGATAERWNAAKSALESVWQWYAQLNDVLEKATRLRGTKSRPDPEQLTQLDWLLHGPSIELATSGVPVAERGLLGPAQTTTCCSPPQLLDRMRAAFDQVVTVIRACDQKWQVADNSLAPLEAQLAEADQLAAAIGEPHRPDLDRTRAQLAQLRQAVMCDPLAAPETTTAGLAATLATATADLRRLRQLRDNLGAQLAEARQLLAQLRTTVETAAAARAEAETKIAGPATAAPPGVADALETALERIVETTQRGDWRAGGNQLALWSTRAGDALAEARRALAANQAPVATRDELRGRLDAYRAKAYRLGLLEDARVAGLYARAKQALYTAPTDLAEAERLVAEYQQALAGPAPREVAT